MSLSFSRWRGRNPGLSKQEKKHRANRHRRTLALEAMESRTLLTGTVTPLLNAAPDGSGVMLLQTNGNVFMVGGGDNTSNSYYQLTPDSSGNYVAGKWTKLASAGTQRLFFGSTVLQNGDIMTMGGEYSGPNNDSNFVNTGEIYHPATNTWTQTAPYPEPMFGDDTLVTLSNGTVLATYLGGPQNYIYTPTTNTWAPTGTKLDGDQSDEETFVKLPDGSELAYSIFASLNSGTGEAQRYIPSTGQWVKTGVVPVALSDTNDYEIGGAVLLPDGRVFQIGASGHTAYYTPSTNAWTAGPDLPNNLVQDDSPAVVLPNGKVLLAADKTGYNGPATIFEFDPTSNTYTDISAKFPSGFNDGPAFVDRFLMLPSGQVLINNGGNDLVVYTPDSSALASNIPTIKSITPTNTGSFLLTGTLLNGTSEGASYGDDAQMSTDFPIVTFTSSTGQVSYGKTFGWDGSVAQGSKILSTNFTPPPNLVSGNYTVRVIANGASSLPYSLSVNGPSIAVPAAATPNPVFGTITKLSVLGADAGGEASLNYTWSTISMPNGVAAPTFATNTTNASKNDTVTFYAVGTYTFQVAVVNLSGVATTSNVTVNVDPSLASFGLSPSKVQLGPLQSFQFVASGLDQFGNQISSSVPFTWSVVSGGGTVSQTGVYTAPAQGTIATIKVTTGTLSLTSTAYVLSNPWFETDIGSPTTAGNAADNGAGNFTLLGAGTGITGTKDQLQYAFLSPTGNATVQAQVLSLNNTNSAAEAGVMFRNDTSPGSMDVAVTITPSSGLVFSYRTQTNGPTLSYTTPRVIAGDYVKIVRVGNLFTGYYSVNGTTWIQAGATVNVSMNPNATAGLAVTSSNAANLNTATFAHVLADGNPYVVNAATANPSPVTSTTTTLSVLGGDAAGEPALTYTWVTSANAPGAITPTFATNGTNASKTDLVTFHNVGTYTFTVTMSNALGYFATSSVTVSVIASQSSVVITPQTATVQEGGKVQLTAAVVDQFGNKLPSQPRFTFSMIAGGAGGFVSSSGLYTAPSNRYGVDHVNVTGAGTAAVSTITVLPGFSIPGTIGQNVSASASGGSVAVFWGADSASLVTASDGLRLLPVGRKTDLPWANINTLMVTLNRAQTLGTSDVKVTGINVASYGPVRITRLNGTIYLIDLARPIAKADRVTVTIGNANVTTYTRRIDVLPGDVNDDGVVNATDATIATNYLLSTFTNADIFGNRVVSQKSVKAIQLLNGTTLPALT